MKTTELNNKPDSHYAQELCRILEDRCQANPRYSLRAFARDLGMSPPRLSRILNRERGLSVEAAQDICKRLGLSERETQHFCARVVAEDGRSKKERTAAEAKLEQLAGDRSATLVKQLEAEAFRVISDWYHFAIVELLRIKAFKNDPDWIASRLGISRYEAAGAVQRLLALELIEKTRDGKLKKTDAVISTSDGIPSEAIRKYNRQVLEKAGAAITTQTIHERSLGTVTSAVHAEDLPEIFAELARMRREFNLYLETLASRRPKKATDEVYTLGMQFFRITEKERK